MKVLRASGMGFCFGVRRAIEIMERKAQEGPIQSLGTIVHNKQVAEHLATLGVSVIEHVEEAETQALAITSHGVGPETIEKAKARGLTVIDTTCPFVRKAQLVAKSLSASRFRVWVFGDPAHPEVQGILGWSDGKGYAGTDPGEAIRRLKSASKIGILSQTTQSPTNFSRFVQAATEELLPTASEIRAVNTVCDKTDSRQLATIALAKGVDAVVVVGGHNSANTRHLAEACRTVGTKAFHIETAAEIEASWFQGMTTVGVTAGTSTPDWVVDEVVERLASMSPLPEPDDILMD